MLNREPPRGVDTSSKINNEEKEKKSEIQPASKDSACKINVMFMLLDK